MDCLLFGDGYNVGTMKVICEQKKFLEALEIVGRAVSSSNTLPVLNNILIKAEGKNLFFSATNLEIAVRYFFECEIRNEGTLTVPAKLLMSYVSLLPNEKIEISATEGLSFSIKAVKSQTRMKGIHADEFPVIPLIERSGNLSLPVKDLNTAIQQVAFSASQNSSRPVLSGVLLGIDRKTLKLVATDSYRLSEKKLQLVKEQDEKVECIIPVKTMQELGKLLSKTTAQEIFVDITKNQILFRIGDIEFTSRLIEGRFPDYERIIPKESKSKAEVDVQDLLLNVRRVSLFARESNNSIKVSLTNDGKLTISTDETKVGEDRAEVDISLTGENNKTALNAEYLLDVLTTIGSQKIFLEMSDKLSPVVIKPCNDDSYVYIIMPLKV